MWRQWDHITLSLKLTWNIKVGSVKKIGKNEITFFHSLGRITLLNWIRVTKNRQKRRTNDASSFHEIKEFQLILVLFKLRSFFILNLNDKVTLLPFLLFFFRCVMPLCFILKNTTKFNVFLWLFFFTLISVFYLFIYTHVTVTHIHSIFAEKSVLSLFTPFRWHRTTQWSMELIYLYLTRIASIFVQKINKERTAVE